MIGNHHYYYFLNKNINKLSQIFVAHAYILLKNYYYFFIFFSIINKNLKNILKILLEGFTKFLLLIYTPKL